MSPLRPGPALGWAATAAAVFHLAFVTRWGGWIVAFPLALLPLSRLPTGRSTFYAGLGLGLALYAPHLGFFYTLFGPAAVLLWTILAFWIGLFLVITRGFDRWLGATFAGQNHRGLTAVAVGVAVLAPAVFWTGTEYFRSELYILRFSWLKLGDAFAHHPPTNLLQPLGTFGLGTVATLAAALTWRGPTPLSRVAGGILALSLAADSLPVRSAPSNAPLPPPRSHSLVVAGAQVESVADHELIPVLDSLLRLRPDAQLFVLPEYSLTGEPDDGLRAWCRAHRRHLVVGGRENVSPPHFQNTAFVVDPAGDIVFRQVKSVPIQFFADGLPATSQSVWDSPWGPIGIAICYDLSYSRVMDRLVTQGARALVIPTMDVAAWGARQHQLHARVAPLRAAEYGLPIVRVASSGISQIVDRRGQVTTSAPFGENVELFAGTIHLAGPGRLPLDRWTSPAATVATGITAAGLLLHGVLRSRPKPFPSTGSTL